MAMVFKVNFYNLILQFPCPLMIKVIMEILFSVLMASLFLSKYQCCMNENFLSKVSIKSNGSLTCVVELLILSLILNKLLLLCCYINVNYTFCDSNSASFLSEQLFIFSIKSFCFIAI